MYGYILVILELLIILCTFGYGKFFYNKHLYILITFHFICIILHIFCENLIYPLSLFFLYNVLVFIFSYIRLKSILLVSLFYLIQNFLLMFIWITTYDIPNLIWGSSVINLFLLYILQIFLLLFLIYILYFIDSRRKLWLQVHKYSKRWTGPDIIIFITSNFLLAFRQYALIVEGSTSNYIYLSFILFATSASIVLISYLIIKTRSNKTFIEQLNNKSKEYSKFIILANEFQHDFKSFLYTVKRYSELKDLEGLNNYINSLEEYSIELLNHSLLDQVYNIKEPAIQGLLIDCIEKCYSNKIKLSLDIQNYPDQDFFLTIDFARCLSILINNAIEHSSGKIYISFSNFNGISSCVVRNTADTPIPIVTIFRRNFSTKKNHQGIGLAILKNIIQTYSHTDLIVENINNWVSFTISSTE